MQLQVFLQGTDVYVRARVSMIAIAIGETPTAFSSSLCYLRMRMQGIHMPVTFYKITNLKYESHDQLHLQDVF
jgi:hypothetical protein